MIGKTVRHFRIEAKLGAGGMGEVYRARDERLDRDVAVKVLPADAFTDETARKRFRKEALALSKLNHPNIATVHDFDTQDGVDFLVMEYVRGTTLSERVSKGALPEKEIARLGGQVADALEEAHEQGIIHRDLKPGNVMVTPKGQAKVLDFGIAKLMRAGGETTVDGTATETHGAPGTLPYMAPEQLLGEAVDARTDVYALGALLYQTATGERPFQGDLAARLMNAILHETPQTPRARNARVSPELERIILKCLEKEPENRYQSAREVEVDLRRLGSSPSAVAQTVPERTSQRNVMVAAMVLLGILLLSPVGFLIYERIQPTSTERAVQRPLTQLTFEVGLQAEPTFSPDGRFLAYSSDRSGNFDIWVQPVGGGDAVQVTKDPAHDWQPDWSPDGNLIAFRSEREGVGVFVIPPLGGHARKVASFGFRPRWSPNGSLILLETIFHRLRVGVVPRYFVVALDGSPPREVLAELVAQFGHIDSVVWHPDGRRVSIFGLIRADDTHPFITVPLDGGDPVVSDDSDVRPQMAEAGVEFWDFSWSPSGRTLYFEGISQSVRNIWKVTVDPNTLRWIGRPERLTTGVGKQTDVTLSPDGKKLAFTARTERVRIWSLPFDAAAGTVQGEGDPITSAGMDAFQPGLSPDGSTLVYVTARAEKFQLRQLSLKDGRETILFDDQFVRSGPRWLRDGSGLAYTLWDPNKREGSIVLLTPGRREEKWLTLPSPISTWLTDWSPDGKWFLAYSRRGRDEPVEILRYPVSEVPLSKQQASVVAADPEKSVWYGRYSPDGKWIAFFAFPVESTGSDFPIIYVVSTGGGPWIQISDGKGKFVDSFPMWSPDGKTIYFLSLRTGFTNVWGIRFDPIQGGPVGERFQVTSLESPDRMMPHAVLRSFASLSKDRLFLPIMEVTGNLWMLENVDR